MYIFKINVLCFRSKNNIRCFYLWLFLIISKILINWLTDILIIYLVKHNIFFKTIWYDFKPWILKFIKVINWLSQAIISSLLSSDPQLMLNMDCLSSRLGVACILVFPWHHVCHVNTCYSLTDHQRKHSTLVTVAEPTRSRKCVKWKCAASAETPQNHSVA